jgi:hypothetical protein
MDSSAISGNPAAGLQYGLTGLEVVQKTLGANDQVQGQNELVKDRIQKMAVDGQARQAAEAATSGSDADGGNGVGSLIDKVT